MNVLYLQTFTSNALKISYWTNQPKWKTHQGHNWNATHSRPMVSLTITKYFISIDDKFISIELQ